MANTKSKKAEPRPNGRPSEYDPKYCGMLIEHMKKGGSIESFGAVIQKSKQTIYTWFSEHDEFLDARKEAMGYLHDFYENIGKRIATGQMRRIKSEEPVLDSQGRPVLDMNGEILYKREYEAATPGQAAWIFLCKNMLGWRDKKDIELSGKEGGPLNFSNLSDAELKKKIDELVAKAQRK